MNNLCIDAGNTRVKYAIFGGETGELLHLERLSDLNREKISALCLTWGVKNAIISTVREERPDLDLIFAELSGLRLILEADTPCPIENLYASPATLGKDRLAAVVGAAAILPNLDVLVIDAGTCIKYDAIDSAGRYFGGSISLGLEMRFAALSHFTARLPLLSPSGENLDLVGTDTQAAMRTGVELGLKYEVEGFIAAYRQKYGAELRVIFTGGNLSFFENMLNNCIFAQPNLLLLGLHQILKHNVELSKSL
jgi:type III pantothenate kinase